MNQDHSESSVERLIKLAGERDLPSAEGTGRARAAAEQAWRRALAGPRVRAARSGSRVALGMTLAAAVAAAIFFAWPREPVAVAPLQSAHVTTIEGTVSVRHRAKERPLSPDAPLYVTSTLKTGQGRLAVAFGNSMSLRLDHDTWLRLDGPERVTLLRGSLYVDSGGINVASDLSIVTPAGEVRHLGTQFQVTVDGNSTRVRVREGRVVLTPAAGNRQDLATGDQLEMHDGEARWQRGLPSFGPEWEWSAQVAPALDIENRPLAEFLSWLAREHGWQLRFSADGLQQRTREIRLHGSVERLDAPAMLQRISLVTGVPLAEKDGVLWIGVQP